MSSEQWIKDAVSDSNKKRERVLSSEQELAIELCCDVTERIVGVTGGAGVGKTLVMGEVYKKFKGKRKSIVLCAPTGRAARRIEELTGFKAKTIHKLLEFPQPDQETVKTDPNIPYRDQQHPLDQEVVIVDESSMISYTLFRQLMNALPRHGVIRFFGDNNQLPPVDDSQKPPFMTLLKEQPSVELTYNFRSDDELLENAFRVLRGSIPLRNPRFEIIYTDNPVPEAVRLATKVFMSEDYQIITPTRKGPVGTLKVNPLLQIKFNPKGTMLKLDRFDEKETPIAVREKDKVLWVKNDYQLDMFNGQLGTVAWVDNDDGSLGMITGGRELTVPPRLKTYSAYHGGYINYDPRKQIELGYIMTTHKAQGSEFDTVIYVMNSAQAWMLDRRNFYTGITRARKQVIVICDRRAMGISMKRHDIDRRKDDEY